MSTTTTEITGDNILDVRDIIARVEELRTELDDAHDDSEENDILDMRSELGRLEELLTDLAGSGGDEKWEGQWYPVTLIRDDYFEDYARELAEDCGMIPSDTSWPCTCIDWEKAAHELQMDYSSVEFDGDTYWYR